MNEIVKKKLEGAYVYLRTGYHYLVFMSIYEVFDLQVAQILWYLLFWL